MAGARRRSAIVVGGGFYGCALALHLDREGFEVALFEREEELLTRASLVNQARLHNGYHYPRSFQTAIRSRANLPAFRKIYPEAVVESFQALYAIARSGSKISTRHFERFCAAADMPLKPAPKPAKDLFDPRLIEAVYVVEEPAFDARALRDRMRAELGSSSVALHLGAEISSVHGVRDEAVEARLASGETIGADWAFNCTYAALNHIEEPRAACDDDPLTLKHQVSEIALVEPTSELAERGVTIMDGPFFSVMPFPARGLHSFTHVRYTHHFAWSERAAEPGAKNPLDLLDAYLGDAPEARSRYSFMIRDARRYLPCLADARYVTSLYDVKTLIAQTAFDDARPILFRRHRDAPRLISILGGKIDNIFDILEYVDVELGLRGRIVPLHG